MSSTASLVAEQAVYSWETRTEQVAEAFEATKTSPQSYLAQRELHEMIPFLFPNEEDDPTKKQKRRRRRRILDYGSGTGTSLQAIASIACLEGSEFLGADVDIHLLQRAQHNCPFAQLHLVEEGTIKALKDGSIDLITSIFVLFEMSSEAALLGYLREAVRLLAPSGRLIAITGSEQLHRRDRHWFAYHTDFDENSLLLSGQRVRAFLPLAGLTFFDYFWTDADYRRLFAAASLQVDRCLPVLGRPTDPFPWKDELTFPLFTLYVLSPICPL